MSREIRYEYSASAQPPDPTPSSPLYTTPLPYATGYYKAIAKEYGVWSAVTSKSFGIVPTDYIAYYPFTGNANDETGNYNATNYKATLTTGVKEESNTAYYYDGSGYMIVPSKPWSENISISFWFYTDNYGSTNPNDSGKAIIFKADDTGYVQDYSIMLDNTNGQRLKFVFGNAIGSYVETITNSNLPVNQWTHIVCIRNNGTIKIYVNGVTDATNTYIFTPINNNKLLYFGRNPGFVPKHNYIGKIDDVRMYNYEILQDKVTEIYNYEKL